MADCWYFRSGVGNNCVAIVCNKCIAIPVQKRKKKNRKQNVLWRVRSRHKFNWRHFHMCRKCGAKLLYIRLPPKCNIHHIIFFPSSFNTIRGCTDDDTNYQTSICSLWYKLKMIEIVRFFCCCGCLFVVSFVVVRTVPSTMLWISGRRTSQMAKRWLFFGIINT